MSIILLKGIVLMSLISWVYPNACYLSDKDFSEEETCGRRFYPVLKIRKDLPDEGKIDNNIFLKGNVLKRYSEAGDDVETEFQDEDALMDLKNNDEPLTCEAPQAGTAEKKMVFKGKVPIDLSALLEDGVDGDNGINFDTTGKKLVYRGIVPIKIKNLRNAL